MNIAIYDLDNTITARPTFTLFLLFYARQAAPFRLVALPIWIIALLGYRLGLYSRKILKQFGIAMFMGTKICPDTLSRIAAHFAGNVVSGGLQPGAVERIAVDRRRGAMLVLATAAPEFYASTVSEMLGFDAVVATRHIAAVDGKVTNRIDGENCYAAEKLRRIEEWMLQEGINKAQADICFYSDDISDRPTLDFANRGYAINPSGNFAKAASIAGWDSLNFRNAPDAVSGP